jgi:hypothetical protein
MVISHNLLYAVLKLTMRQLLLIPNIRHFLSSTQQRMEMNLFSSPNNARSYPAKMLLGWGATLRFLCIGASITYGVGSSDGNWYRCALRFSLRALGNPVNMARSVRAGTMQNNHMEG